MVVETTFVLADPRYKSLSASAKVVFWALWARAFHDRRDILPNWYDTAAIQHDTNLDQRTIGKAVAMLQQRCLIEYTEDDRVIVLGVRGKGNIKWKDNGKESIATLPKTRPQRMTKKRKEEKRKEYITEVWGFWSEGKIQDSALVPSAADIQAIKTATTSYTPEQIGEAINKYAQILREPEYKLTTRWTLSKFLNEHMGSFFPGSHPEDKYRFKDAGMTREQKIQISKGEA